MMDRVEIDWLGAALWLFATGLGVLGALLISSNEGMPLGILAIYAAGVVAGVFAHRYASR
jgi:hypothetical protein